LEGVFVVDKLPLAGALVRIKIGAERVADGEPIGVGDCEQHGNNDVVTEPVGDTVAGPVRDGELVNVAEVDAVGPGDFVDETDGGSVREFVPVTD